MNADLTLNDLPNFPKSMISEQTMLAVVRNFSPTDPAQIQLIVAGVAEIAINFRLHLNGRASRNERSSFKDDRKRLLELSKAARNLKNKLNDISLLHEVFWMQVRKLSIEEKRQRAWKTVDLANFFSGLELIISGATSLADDKEALCAFREEPLLASNREDPSTALIWKPFFRLWTRCGNDLKPRSSSVLSALSALHNEFGLPPPSQGRMKEAVEAFLGRSRPSKRRRGKEHADSPRSPSRSSERM